MATEAGVMPQHERALAAANVIRKRRSKVKHEIAHLPRGEAAAMVRDILSRTEIEEALRTMALGDLLKAIERVGDHGVEKLLTDAQWMHDIHITSAKSLGSMTARQRVGIAGVLAARIG